MKSRSRRDSHSETKSKKQPKPFQEISEEDLMAALNNMTALVDTWCEKNGILSVAVAGFNDLCTAVQNAVKRERARAVRDTIVEPLAALPPAQVPRGGLTAIITPS